VAMDAAPLAGRTTREELARAADSAHHWPGAARAARAVSLADGWAESPLETRGRLRLIGAGFGAPELQVEIRVGGRLIGVVDWASGWRASPTPTCSTDGARRSSTSPDCSPSPARGDGGFARDRAPRGSCGPADRPAPADRPPAPRRGLLPRGAPGGRRPHHEGGDLGISGATSPGRRSGYRRVTCVWASYRAGSAVHRCPHGVPRPATSRRGSGRRAATSARRHPRHPMRGERENQDPWWARCKSSSGRSARCF
jgi:hypothetical protein